jgi:hypothetical protein
MGIRVFIQVGVHIKPSDFLDENYELRPGWETLLLGWTTPELVMEVGAQHFGLEEDEWIHERIDNITWGRECLSVRPIYIERYRHEDYRYMIGFTYLSKVGVHQIDPIRLSAMMAQAKEAAQSLGIKKDPFCTLEIATY